MLVTWLNTRWVCISPQAHRAGRCQRQLLRHVPRSSKVKTQPGAGNSLGAHRTCAPHSRLTHSTHTYTHTNHTHWVPTTRRPYRSFAWVPPSQLLQGSEAVPGGGPWGRHLRLGGTGLFCTQRERPVPVKTARGAQRERGRGVQCACQPLDPGEVGAPAMVEKGVRNEPKTGTRSRPTRERKWTH
jgi:hypothetical protein